MTDLLRDQALPRSPFAPLGDPLTHMWRVQRMAKSAGLDLSDAVRQGALAQADWAAIVTRCRGCDCADGCAHWLDDATDAARPVPGGCINQGTFEHLAKALERDTGQ